MMDKFVKWLLRSLFYGQLEKTYEAGYKQGYKEGECVGSLEGKVNSIEERRRNETMRKT